MTSDQQQLVLPTELDARIRYICSSRTVNGSLQAKCAYLLDGNEYNGIIFAPDGEEWFNSLTEGQIVKAKNIGPCNDPAYAGEYKGAALPFFQQHLQPDGLEDALRNLAAMGSCVPSDPAILAIMLPNLLRRAADTIDELLLKDSQALLQQEEQLNKQAKVNEEDLKFRSKNDWADIIASSLRANQRFHFEPFSAITMFAYIEANFDNFLQGDLIRKSKNLPRWRTIASSALQSLIDCDFIERVPGTAKHYQLTTHTRSELF